MFQTDFPHIVMGISTLRKLLRQMGFRYMKDYGLLEKLYDKTERVQQRVEYLKKICRLRRMGRPVYFCDESWVDSRGLPIKTWCDKRTTPLELRRPGHVIQPGLRRPKSTWFQSATNNTTLILTVSQSRVGYKKKFRFFISL